jgi:hypothetical protein
MAQTAKAKAVKLELTYAGRERKLTASLVNDLPRAIEVVAGDLQPCQVALTGPHGAAPAADSRNVRKYDVTVYRRSFQTVPSGGRLVLVERSFEPRGASAWSLSWGPFVFENLAPGVWEAVATFDSVLDDWFDEASRTMQPNRNAWTGQLRSDAVECRL